MITSTDYSLLNARSALRQGVNHITAVRLCEGTNLLIYTVSVTALSSHCWMLSPASSSHVWPYCSAQGLPFFININIINTTGGRAPLSLLSFVTSPFTIFGYKLGFQISEEFMCIQTDKVRASATRHTTSACDRHVVVRWIIQSTSSC